jgi:Tfp pilus assembly protein PilN
VRPINLIPEQERRRQGGAGRTGPLAFIVIGALFIALAGVVALVITSNQVSERESELASLKVRTAGAQARADRLSPFADFNEVKEQRTETISELADSRFDWSRVLHELSLVMPRWVILDKISGSAGAGIEGAEAGGDLGASIKGPSLSLTGCAKSQTRVAQFVAALKRIDGVTRVGLNASGIGVAGGEGSGGSEGGGSLEGSSCSGPLQFAVVIAFDGAPLPVDSSEAASSSESESTESSSEGESESAGGSEETTETSASGSTTKTTTESIPPKS